MQDEEGQELQGLTAEATVRKPDGTEETVNLLDQDGIPTGLFRTTDKPGDYSITVRATPRTPSVVDGATPQEFSPREAIVRFMVFDRNLELENPVANPWLLSNISELTGGKSMAPEQLGTLLEELSRQADELIEWRETTRSLYDGWPVLALFIGILGCEWFLRKKWGLV